MDAETANALADLTLALENLSYVWAMNTPEERGYVFGEVAITFLDLLGKEKVKELAERINRIIKENGHRLLTELDDKEVDEITEKLVKYGAKGL